MAIKKSTIFVQSSWNFVKIITSWGNHFFQVSWWLEKNCGFFISVQFLNVCVFVLLRPYFSKNLMTICIQDFRRFEKVILKICHGIRFRINIIQHWSHNFSLFYQFSWNFGLRESKLSFAFGASSLNPIETLQF